MTQRWIAHGLAIVALWSAGCAAHDRSGASLQDPTGVTSAASVVSGSPETSLAGRTRPLEAAELDAMQQLMREAEAIRGLRFQRPVEVHVQDAEAIMAFVEHELDQEDLERARIVYGALGLLDPTLDVRDMLTRLMGEQILGYYDPKRQRMVVRDTVMESLGATAHRDGLEPGDDARIVLLHELVHALQDEHLGLGEGIDLERPTDVDNAFRAVMEGDATLAMIGFALQQQGVPLQAITHNAEALAALKASVAQMPLSGTELMSAPAIVRVPLLSAYVDGLAFAAHLHGQGGWASVDAAHAAKPISVEQVLHPERYDRGELPDPVPTPRSEAMESSGWTLYEEDTLGELELSVYFAQGSDEATGRRAADGWSGDRLTVYRKERSTAVIWYTSWDTPRDAIVAQQAAQRAQATQGDAAAGREVLRHGRAVLIAHDVPESLRGEVSEAFHAWATTLPETPPIAGPRAGPASRKTSTPPAPATTAPRKVRHPTLRLLDGPAA